MPDNENLPQPQEQGTPVPQEDANYIDAIKKLKETTVSKELYEKSLEREKKLTEALISGNAELSKEEHVEKVDLDGIRKKLLSNDPNMTNLDYVQNALAFRNEMVKQGQKSPFLPYKIDSKEMPTAYEVETEEKVVKILQECVDYAQGDSEIFTQEIQRRMVDSGLPNTRR